MKPKRHKSRGKPAPPRAGLQRVCSKPTKRVIGRPFQPGQSGNPSGRRAGSVSLTAALKRAVTRLDAEAIAQKLITLAKRGEPAALKILLDRCDGPLNGPMAFALAQANAAMPQAGSVRVIIADNHRGDSDQLKRMSSEELMRIANNGKPPFDHAGFVQCARELYGIPATTDATPAAAPPPSEGSEAEPEGEPLNSLVQSGAEFLES